MLISLARLANTRHGSESNQGLPTVQSIQLSNYRYRFQANIYPTRIGLQRGQFAISLILIDYLIQRVSNILMGATEYLDSISAPRSGDYYNQIIQ